MDRQTRVLLVTTQVCFGVFPILGKLALEAFEPRAVLVWRLFAAALPAGSGFPSSRIPGPRWLTPSC